jgi:hypothetical protein
MGESSKVNEREVDMVDAVEIHSDHEYTVSHTAKRREAKYGLIRTS